MFLASFAFFIRVFTSFQSLAWGLVFLIGMMCGVSFFVFFFKKGRKIWFRMLVLVVGAWILSMGSVLLFWWNNAPQIGSDFWTLGWQNLRNEARFEALVGDFEVLEQSKSDRYVIKSMETSQIYTLKTEKELRLGGNYTIGGSMKPVDLSLTYGERFLRGGSGDLGSKLVDFLRYEFSYEKRMLMKGYQGALYPKFIVENPNGEDSKGRIVNVRSWVRSQIFNFFDKRSGALLLGMLIGDKSQLENADYQQFLESGIVHIIAVSGGNLVMIVVFLGAVLFFLPFYLRNAVIIGGVVVFSLIAGGDSSVVRALIMSVLSLLALFWGREVNIWRLMKYAFVVMLCYNPYFLAYDLGFLLSFGALIGIVSVSERYGLRSEGQTAIGGKKEKKIRFPFFDKMIKEYGLPTLGASLGTLPILLFFIGSTNLTGILINLLIVPMVPVITIGGFVSIVLGNLSGWNFWSVPISWLLELIFWLSEWAERWALRIEVENMWVRWGILLTLGGILFCIVRIVQEEKKKLE